MSQAEADSCQLAPVTAALSLGDKFVGAENVARLVPATASVARWALFNKGGNGVMVLMWLCQMLWPLRCEVQLSVRRGRLRHQVRLGHNLDTGNARNAVHNSELIVFRNIRQSLLSNPLEL